MADILGIDIVPQISIDAVLTDLIFDEASYEPQVENDERKPANKTVPVTHYTGKRMKLTFKGPLEGQVLPGAGTSVEVSIGVTQGFDTTTLPQDLQDLIAGAYGNWCVMEPKITHKQGIMEYDGLDIMSDCVTTVPSSMPAL